MEAWKGWEGRVRAVLEAITQESEFTEDDFEGFFGEENPLMGMEVVAVGEKTGKTTDKGEPIVNVTFSPAA
jgi:hypothetical protein